MKSIIRRLRKGTGVPGEYGQALAEFALVMPIFAIIVFGLVDMARAMQSYVTIQEAARDGVRYAVTGRIDCVGPTIQSRENCIEQAVKDRTESLNDAATAVDTEFRSWDYPSYADPAAENDAGEQCDAVEVEVSYDYEPVTPIFKQLVGNNIPMTARERLVNEPFGTCS